MCSFTEALRCQRPGWHMIWNMVWEGGNNGCLLTQQLGNLAQVPFRRETEPNASVAYGVALALMLSCASPSGQPLTLPSLTSHLILISIASCWEQSTPHPPGSDRSVPAGCQGDAGSFIRSRLLVLARAACCLPRKKVGPWARRQTDLRNSAG